MSDDIKFSVFDDDVGKDDFVRKLIIIDYRLDLPLLRLHLFVLMAALENGYILWNNPL